VITLHGLMGEVVKMKGNRTLWHYWVAALLERLAIKRTDGVVAISPYALRVVLGITPRARFIPNAVRSEFKKDILRQGSLERQGRIGNAAPEDQPEAGQPQAAPQQAPQIQRGGGNQMGDAPMQMPGMNPAAHFGAHSKMIAATNAGIAAEMNSRRAQAAAQADRQHEYQMEMLKQQTRQQEFQQPDQQKEQLEQIRKARNRSLLGAAGLGGYAVRSGPGGVKKTPHQFKPSPFSSALLGD
jgi:hypothetical protein